MNIPFTYIENCRIEDPIFAEGLRRFAGVACAVKNVVGMRVAQVGMRPKPFCSVMFNESELMEKFDIHVIPVNLAVIQDKYNRILETRKDDLAKGVVQLRKMYEIDDLSEPVLDKVYAFVLLYQEIFAEYNVAAVSAECWTAMQLMVGCHFLGEPKYSSPKLLCRLNSKRPKIPDGGDRTLIEQTLHLAALGGQAQTG